MGKGRMRRAEAVRALKPKAKRTEWRLCQVEEEPLPGPHSRRGKPRPILEGARGGAEGTEREDPKMPVACDNGVPREPAYAVVVEHVAPT